MSRLRSLVFCTGAHQNARFTSGGQGWVLVSGCNRSAAFTQYEAELDAALDGGSLSDFRVVEAESMQEVASELCRAGLQAYANFKM